MKSKVIAFMLIISVVTFSGCGVLGKKIYKSNGEVMKLSSKDEKKILEDARKVTENFLQAFIDRDEKKLINTIGDDYFICNNLTKEKAMEKFKKDFNDNKVNIKSYNIKDLAVSDVNENAVSVIWNNGAQDSTLILMKDSNGDFKVRLTGAISDITKLKGDATELKQGKAYIIPKFLFEDINGRNTIIFEVKNLMDGDITIDQKTKATVVAESNSELYFSNPKVIDKNESKDLVLKVENVKNLKEIKLENVTDNKGNSISISAYIKK